jgi:hypothetical protein
MPEYNDKRRYPRAAVIDLYVNWGRSEACRYHGDQITSLSLGGCFLVTEKQADPDDIIYIQLWETHTVGGLYKGRIRYQLQVSDPFPPIGIGVEFIDIDERDRKNLQEVITYYSKQLSQ